VITVVAADRVGQRIADHLTDIAGTTTELTARTSAVVVAAARPRTPVIASVATACATRGLPLVVAELNATELRAGPVFEPAGPCYHCHCPPPTGAAAELAAWHDAHPDDAPSGHLVVHLEIAARTALRALTEHRPDTLVLRLVDNTMYTVSSQWLPECPHQDSLTCQG
jgi:hypothetical protein